MKKRGAQKGNRNAAKKPDERRRKGYVSFFGQRWSIEVGEQIQANLEQHNQSQKQFLDNIVKEKILTSKGANTMNKFNGKLTLRNDFHNTEATVIVKNGIISHSSLKRARAKLCGMKDCSCGDIRGTQDMIIDTCYDRGGEYAKVAEK